MTIKDNRLQPMKTQPQSSALAVTQQTTTNTARGITGSPQQAPAKRRDTQGPTGITPIGIAPVDR